MKSNFFNIFILVCLFIFSSCENKNKHKGSENATIYDIPLENLIQTKVITDTSTLIIDPSFNLSIEDLMALRIVKNFIIDTLLTVSYDIPLEDLLNVEVKAYKKDTILRLNPSYEMSLNGLLEFEIQKSKNETKTLTLSYDISLEGLMKIKLIKEE